MERLSGPLTTARYVIALGVIASLVMMLALFVVIVGRSVIVVSEVGAALTSDKSAKLLVVDCIELAELILLAVALYIIALGLFELFIAPAPMPAWLTIASFDDLKTRLINIVVVALGVNFFGQVVTWNGVTNLLPFGVAIGAVIIALTAFGALGLGRSHTNSTTPPTPTTPAATDSADR